MPDPGTLIIVANTGPNSISGFWSPLIGKHGIITSIGADGLWDVVVGEQVIEGVLPDRFGILDPVPPLVQQVKHRLMNTLILLGIVSVIVALLLLMNKVVPS